MFKEFTKIMRNSDAHLKFESLETFIMNVNKLSDDLDLLTFSVTFESQNFNRNGSKQNQRPEI